MPLAEANAGAGTPSPAFVTLLLALEARESAFVERLYDAFFDLCPEALPLFGEYAISEREEMVRETLRSLLAVEEGASWIEANLVALGRSHVEYGVEPYMYVPFVDAFLQTAAEILAPEEIEPAARAALETNLDRVASVMAGA